MKLNKTTWLSLLLAVVLGSGVYGYELIKDRRKSSRTTTSQSQQPLFALQETDIHKIIIARPQQTLEIVKTEDKTNPWQLKQPQDVSANTGTVAFLLDLLASGKPQRTFIVPADERSQYGLDEPIATVTFVSSKGNQQIILGQPSINEETIYAQIGSSSADESESEVALVTKNWQYAVEQDLEAWKQPEQAK
ncbi:DUF4340 domain-containing protein [Myxosarcina sp. GI1(2024)]